MNLTLEVISANGAAMGASRRKVFGAEGGRIGRAVDCDWVLPSPDKFVSRHHATISFKYGQFYVKAEGENGVAVNNPHALLAFGTPSPIKQGDRLYIDDYEILVSVPNEARPSLIVGDPFADESEPEALIPDVDSGDQDLDPLSRLPGAPARPGAGRRGYTELPQGDVLSDPFIPPAPLIPPEAIESFMPMPPMPPMSPMPPRAAASELPPMSAAPNIGAIPTDPDAWNKTTYSGGNLQRPEPAPPRPQVQPVSPPQARQPTRPMPPRAPLAAAPPMTPIPMARTPMAPNPMAPNPMGQGPIPAASAPARGPIPAPRPTQPRPPLAGTVDMPRAAPMPAQPQPPARRSAPPAPAPLPVESASAAGFDVDAMLRAAGVEPRDVSPETAATLGQILSVVVQGTIDALRVRDEVKSQFRLAVTRVRVTENNPLTFAIDAADAINSLLNRRNPAFLPPLEAFQRAFDDIRSHEMAMLAGMRAGFENLMARFDPEHLQEGFDKQVKRGSLLGGAKAKYWDLYTDYFAGLRGDRDDAFRRLFGEEFAAAYEKQVEVLKRGRNQNQS
jgi:type VI secretion system FHA domain protein